MQAKPAGVDLSQAQLNYSGTTMVDVVITTYDRPALTLEAVDSVLSQSYDNVNLFVIEDGSDNLVLPGDARIQFHRLKENHGPAYCRNLGASLGHAPYLAFLDSDDLWHHRKLEKQVAWLENNQEPYLHTNEAWFRNEKPVKQKGRHRKQGGQFLDRALERCLVSPSSVIFRREFWQASGGFNPHFRVAEDYELWLRLLFKQAIGYIDEPLTIKRAGDWPQLSTTIEIDRYRVLALHRFFRIFKNDEGFARVKEAWQKTILAKISILIKGAEKYGHETRLRQYQAWLSALERSRQVDSS